jgi:hypothetical protein
MLRLGLVQTKNVAVPQNPSEPRRIIRFGRRATLPPQFWTDASVAEVGLEHRITAIPKSDSLPTAVAVVYVV